MKAFQEADRGVDLEARFRDALAFPAYLESVRESSHPWEEFFRRAVVPQGLLDRAQALRMGWKLLALSEGWCGDAANTLPYLARLAQASTRLELRVLSRDEHPDLMDAHLTGAARSIPVVLILDDHFREVGWWGPRPALLQEWFLREIKGLPQPERYPKLRAWYARDRGRAILSEVLDAIPEEI